LNPRNALTAAQAARSFAPVEQSAPKMGHVPVTIAQAYDAFFTPMPVDAIARSKRDENRMNHVCNTTSIRHEYVANEASS
jgi:hypothetical protein